MKKAFYWLKAHAGRLEIDFTSRFTPFSALLAPISSHKLVGIELVLDKTFDEIGFGQIKNTLFKALALYRLVYPKSKLKTTLYLSV